MSLLAILLGTIALWSAPSNALAADDTPASAPPAVSRTGVVRTGEHAASEAKHEEGEARRPLLDFQVGEAIWIVAIFSLLMLILYPTAWKNVQKGLQGRQDRIRKEIADAEAARARAEATLKEYNQQLATAEERVRTLITNATVEGEKMATQIRSRAQQESEEIKERALHDIDQARKQAVAEIYREAATLATAVAEKILRRNLNADDQRHLIDQSLEQLTQAN